MKTVLAILLAVGVAAAQTATNSGTKPLERQAKGNTLTSSSNPAITITFGKEYKYVGGQRWDLYHTADAEQHLFVKAGPENAVQSLYWVQFEHFLPDNEHTYHYAPDRTTKIGGVEFIYDTSAYADYSGLNRDAMSDGAYAQALLEKNGYKFPKAAVRTRMIYLPTPDQRSELMIIYAESIDAKDLPAGAEQGVAVDERVPDLAKRALKNARSGMQIRRR